MCPCFAKSTERCDQDIQLDHESRFKYPSQELLPPESPEVVRPLPGCQQTRLVIRVMCSSFKV